MKLFSKILASEAIEIRDGRAVSAKGRHSRQLLGAITDVCSDQGIDCGEIWFKGNGSFSFSGSISQGARQQLRNVIVNSQ